MDIEDQERIFIEIYNECDNNNTNTVQVSVLLSYIGPHIDSSSHHFEELKNVIDPNNINPFIDKQTFLNAMINWTEKFKNDVDFNFNNEEISRQSTPTQNLRVDYDALNLSSISAYSLTGSVLSTIDPNILQDQNNELLHQNKKISECLDDVKYQLTGLEEQNVSLQNEIERVNRNWQVDQKLIKTLQTKCAEYDKEREEHAKLVNENKINRENLILSKKIKVELGNRINELEAQNKVYMETIEKFNDLSNKKDEEIKNLQIEIEERDAELLKIQEKEAEWQQKCAQSEIDHKHVLAENYDLKSHIESLETLLENGAAQDHQTSFKMENFEPDRDDSPPQKENSTMSLSPEDDYYDKILAKQLHTSPHESLQSELSQINTSECFNTCEQRINQLEDEIGKLCEQLNDRAQEVEMVKNSRVQVEEELIIAHKEIKNQNEKFNSLTTEFNHLKMNLESAQNEKQQVKIEYKQLYSKLSYYKVINKNFKIQLEAKLNEIINLRKKITDKETKVQNFEKEMQQLHQTAHDKLNKLKEEILLKENENKQLNDKLLEMKNNLEMFEEEVKELKLINCKLMNELSSLERAAKLERKRNTRVDLNAKVNKLEEQIEEIQGKNQTLVSTISSITSDKQQLIAKLELLENNDYGKRKIEALETKLHKYRHKVTDLENHITAKTKELQELQMKQDDLEMILKKSQAEHLSLMAYVEQVKNSINANKDFLKTSTYYTSDVWSEILRNIFPHLNISNLLNVSVCIDENANEQEDGPLQDEINLLNNQIHVTAILLKAFAQLKDKMKINDENKSTTTTTTSSSNNSSNKIELRKLYNAPHESVENNESFLSKLTPKRFFLKPPTLLLKSKSKTHFVYPPMSPECPQPEMTAVQTHNNIENTQPELNNNVSIRAMSDAIESKTKLLIEPLKEETIPKEEKEDDEEIKVQTSVNSTFTKTSYNDSYIEKILMEQKIDDPLTKIEETLVFSNDGSEISGSESVSSKDDDDDDDDEDIEKKNAKRKLKRERKIREEEEMIKERLTKQVRSMSEGAAVVHHLSKDGDVTVFPNLQDNVLNTLGLMGSDQPKERLTEEEIELKFQTLSLAFNIDAVTIKDRLERQQRQRDQAEENLSTEITRFVKAVHKLHPLCVDAETTELVTSLLDRLQLIVQASHRISTSAEIFGSVQQEWRIAESVNLMLSHLRNLIKQRDAARRQLQVTKRMLQETTSPAIKKPVVTGTTRRLTINTLPTTINGRVAPLRRASIAVIPRALESPSATASSMRRVAVRRTSEGISGERQEPSSRHWDCRRAQEWTPRGGAPLLSRPSRLDINQELTKIQEGSTESFTSNADADDQMESSGDEDVDFLTPTMLQENPLIVESEKFLMHQQHATVKQILLHYLAYYGQIAKNVFDHWAENGTLHEICFIGTIICFAMATILLCNTIVEIEVARSGVPQVPWKWVTWQEFLSLFYTI